MKLYLLNLVGTLLIAFKMAAQPCINAGQTPSTAIPVCGTTTFTQTGAPQCGSFTIPVTCANAGPEYMDRSPYWYKFTCYSAGTLGFVITPADPGDDYDWQLFDITDHTPDEIFHNHALSVSYNWSGEPGITGASSIGSSSMVCGGLNQPLFASMSSIQQGHDYLLMISHYENSGYGYTLEFKGGTAVLYDPAEPGLSATVVNCSATALTVKLTKKLMCSSLSADGSDFRLSTSSSAIVSATGFGCTEIEMDSVSLELNAPLPAGDYWLTCTSGIDGNTLLDNCGRAISDGDHIPFSVPPPVLSAMESVLPPGCSPRTIKLILNKPVNCSSVAADGSDFNITGTAPVAVSSAGADCTNGFTNVININFSAPVFNAGSFNVTLKQGIDGNTLINDCGFQSPAGSWVSFTTGDTVSAGFSYRLLTGCQQDTVTYFYSPANSVSAWHWTFDKTDYSGPQNPVKIYTAPGIHTAQLIASNAVCADTSTISFTLNNKLNADFSTNSPYCPNDAVTIKNNSSGNITRWLWTYGNGNSSEQQLAIPQHYPVNGKESEYRVGLKIFDQSGCMDSISRTIKILAGCNIAVPSAFSPNHDGLNDFLYPLNAFNTDKFNFSIYNRWGQLIFYTNDPLKKWDGCVRGNAQPAGMYVWTLQFSDPVTGNKRSMKGTTVLIR